MKQKLVLVLLLFFVYRASLGYAQYLPQPLKSWLSLAHFKTKTAVANLADAFYLPVYRHSRLVKKLPGFNLLMSPADFQKLEADARQSVKLGYNAKQTAGNQKISLQFEGREYPATISFHGGGANDFVFNKNDYNLKIGDSQTVVGYAGFNLFNPSVHNWLVPLLAGRVAQQLELYVNDQFPVLVKINHKTSGVYLLEEKINEDFLAKRGLTDAQVIKLRDETRLPHRINTVALDAHILSGLDWEIANADPLKNDDAVTLGRLDQFYKAVKAGNFARISQLIDLDYWARFDAYRELLAIDHDTAGANFIMIYRPEENKFYPVARSEGELNRLAISGGNTLKSFNNYDPHLAGQYDYPRLFVWLNLDPQFRLLKYRYLYQLLNYSGELAGEFTAVYDQYGPVLLYDGSDEASVWEKKKIFRSYLQTINGNFGIIRKELNFAQAIINVINHDGQATLEIIPDALVPLQFDRFELKLEDGSSLDVTETIKAKMIIAAITPELKVVPTAFTFSFSLRSAVASVEVNAKNQITGAPVEAVFTAVGSN